MSPTRDIPNRVAIMILIGIMILSAWMRFDGMGRFSFWTDEMYHVIGAQSMLECGEPVVPGLYTYWRAFVVTGMTAISFEAFGVSEWSARLPFAIISLCMLGVVYMVLQSRFSRMIALATTVFIAFSPQFLQIGRECRMYAPFSLLYFVGVFVAFHMMEINLESIKRHPVKAVIAVLAAAVLFALTFSLQNLAVNIGITFACYSFVMIGYLMVAKGPGSTIRSRYVLAIGLLCTAVVGCVLLTPSIASNLIELLRTKMDWDTRGKPSSFCLWFFNYYYPTAWYLYPIGAVILIRQYGRLGVFMVCAFLPLLLAHMYIFTSRIAERYFIYILPFFFLTSATVIEALIWGVVGWIRNLWQTKAKVAAIATACCALPAAWIFIHPWLGYSLELRRYGMGPDWKQIAPDLEQACNTGIVITNWPREVLYYGGRFPDYFATQTYEYTGEPDHVVAIGDRTVQVKYLSDAERLINIINSEPEVYFITTDWAYSNDAFLNKSIRDVIQENMREITFVASGNDRIVIYQSK